MECKTEGCSNEVVKYKVKGLCAKCYQKEYRAINKEKLAFKKKDKYKKNREKILAKSKEYRSANRDVINAKDRLRNKKGIKSNLLKLNKKNLYIALGKI